MHWSPRFSLSFLRPENDDDADAALRDEESEREHGRRTDDGRRAEEAQTLTETENRKNIGRIGIDDARCVANGIAIDRSSREKHAGSFGNPRRHSRRPTEGEFGPRTRAATTTEGRSRGNYRDEKVFVSFP